MVLTPVQRTQTLEVLRKRAAGEALKDALDEDSFHLDVEFIVLRDQNPKRHRDDPLPEIRVREMLLDILDDELLQNWNVRNALALGLGARARQRLLPASSRARSPAGEARDIASRWRRGSAFAHEFCQELGLDPIFAGAPEEPTAPAPSGPPTPLRDYQEVAAAQVLGLLEGRIPGNKALLSMPTGSGKTRTAATALLQHHTKVAGGRILWIAQTDEVCQQALDEFERLKPERAPNLSPARLGGHWGDNDDSAAWSDIIVAGIQKLASTPTARLTRLGQDLSAIVIDEAHSASAPSYREVLARIGIAFDTNSSARIPILGLTATPGRATADETRRLARFFAENLLTPWPHDVNPIERLRSEGYLATPRHKGLPHTGEPLDFHDNPRWRSHWEQFRTIPPGMYKRIGEDGERNRTILAEIRRALEEPNGGPALVFACSVVHAAALAALLRRQNIPADYIASNTHPTKRERLVRQLKDGTLRVLCNYGVLAVGFDAPTVNIIVIARPTTSPVLYEQMIGRGMRGQKSGGTEGCLLIDIKDNIDAFPGGQLAYQRFAHLWGEDSPIADIRGVPASAPSPRLSADGCTLVLTVNGFAQAIPVRRRAMPLVVEWYDTYRRRIEANDLPSVGWLHLSLEPVLEALGVGHRHLRTARTIDVTLQGHEGR